jgi:hypothetical protein
MSHRAIYVLAAIVIVAAIAIVQFAQHLPAALERHAGPADVTIGFKDNQSEQ